MKPFDILGALCVTAWVVLMGAFTYERYATPPPTHMTSDDVAIVAGDSWMILNRNSEEVGFVHETRTELEDGWLLEYELVFVIDVAGQRRLLETHTRATLDNEARLRQFSGDITSFVGSFTVKGQAVPDGVTLTTTIGGSEQERMIPLKETPRLSNNAINQLVANPEELTPGQKIQHEYFDPMTSGMNTLTYEFIEKTTVDLYDETRTAYHFRHQMMGDEFDVYISPQGEVLIQEFPMRVSS